MNIVGAEIESQEAKENFENQRVINYDLA